MQTGFDVRAQRFLLAVNRLRAQGDLANRQISSNRRVNDASDSPEDVGVILQLQSKLSSSAQARQNLNSFLSEVNTAETGLSQAVSLMEKARTIAVQGANDPPTADRKTLAAQVQGLMDQMVGIAQTNVEGRYVFGGGRDTQIPYTQDASQTNGVKQTAAFLPARQVQDAQGNLLPAGLDAGEIFDASDSNGALPENVFANLTKLKKALEANDAAGVQGSIDGLRTSSTHLNSKLSHYGILQTRTQDALDAASKFELDWQKSLSDVRDTDVPAAIISMKLSETGLEATLGAEASRPRTSLFDYLK